MSFFISSNYCRPASEYKTSKLQSTSISIKHNQCFLETYKTVKFAKMIRPFKTNLLPIDYFLLSSFKLFTNNNRITKKNFELGKTYFTSSLKNIYAITKKHWSQIHHSSRYAYNLSIYNVFFENIVSTYLDNLKSKIERILYRLVDNHILKKNVLTKNVIKTDITTSRHSRAKFVYWDLFRFPLNVSGLGFGTQVMRFTNLKSALRQKVRNMNARGASKHLSQNKNGLTSKEAKKNAPKKEGKARIQRYFKLGSACTAIG